ncbi:uncharacterized protein LOC106470768, partial [Limulus polyphemus]|uniref:Uncharacterized protein LOC106470768 n=1 Tax=Limulus polyphemus TaxID=6850 RepID=A0ABM1TGV2_LIMPO
MKHAVNNAEVFGIEKDRVLFLNDFLSAVGQLKFRGTSLLLRSPQSVLSIMKKSCKDSGKQNEPPFKRQRSDHCQQGDVEANRLDTSSQFEYSNYEVDEASSNNELYKNAQMDSVFISGGHYDLATHSVRVRRSGTLVDVHSLWELEGKPYFSDFTPS